MYDPRDRYDPDQQDGVDWWMLAVLAAFIILIGIVVALAMIL